MPQTRVASLSALTAALLLVCPALAARLADDPALQRRATLTATNQFVDEVLDGLTRQTRVKLSVDEHCATYRLSLGARSCPLRDLMQAIEAVLPLEWQPVEGGGYNLHGPAVNPPAVDTGKLIAALTALLPRWARPLPEREAYRFNWPSPLPQVYQTLSPQQVAYLEEGGEIPFARLPPAARQALLELRDQMRRQAATTCLRPGWLVPPDQLGLRIRDPRPGGRAVWELVVFAVETGEPRLPFAPKPPAEPSWQRLGYVPHYPPRLSEAPPKAPGGGPTVEHAALQVAARQPGVGVVMWGGYGYKAAKRPEGETPEEMLGSLLPKGGYDPQVWRSAGRAYYLASGQGPPATQPDPPEWDKRLQELKAVLPPEYEALLALKGTSEADHAVAAPWVELTRSLTEGQRQPGEIVTTAQLSPRQQGQLLAGLQAYLVKRFVGILRQALSARVEETSASLRFASHPPPFSSSDPGTLGYSRTLQLTLDGAYYQAAGVPGPVFLPLLPTRDPILDRRIDFEVKDEPPSAVVARLGEVMQAPMVARVPGGSRKLTARFQQKPIRFLLHWIERRTGRVWMKRGSTYVLCPRIPAGVLAAQTGDALDLLEGKVPDPGPTPRGGYDAGVQASISAEDRRALHAADGFVGLDDLSPELREAVENWVHFRVRNALDSNRAQAVTLQGLGNARLRLETTPLLGHKILKIEVPGVRKPVLLGLPPEPRSSGAEGSKP